VSAALPRLAFAQAQSDELTVRSLSDRMVLIAGAGGNVVAVSDGAAVTLVDAGGAGRTEALLSAIAGAFPDLRVNTVFNTHWHHDQTGGNQTLARAGARIIAHANTRLWLTTDVQWPWGGAAEPMPPEAWPTEIFYNESQQTGAGAARAEYGYMLQAHTDGDAYVFFPEDNVLHCGGAIAADRWSDIDWWTGGWLGGVVEATETLLQIANDQTRIVASGGPVFGRAELQAQRDMYAELFVRFRDNLMFRGLSPAEAVAERPTQDFRPEWGDPDPFVIRAFQSLWHYFAPEV
jgi:glyoxylase-like metal-dependent hydrolase (beta-lactamase superfamily II)